MNKINGFLHTSGRHILDGNEEEIILTGWGLGNWLLPEGYMWQSGGNSRFDRPRRIEQVLTELTGAEYAEGFWAAFHDNYIRREDIVYLAQLGYNSVRIPINWRILMREGEGIHWIEPGFMRLDRCLDWCEEAGIYAFLDLHGAPGGQTGANIDDSIDDVPRLFIDPDSRAKCLALWGRLAERYRGREIVGGYDLLNEPIAPPSSEHKDYDDLIPDLIRFYQEAISLIRGIDRNHLLSIEGAHWATDIGIFRERFDDNMVIHFHRYAEKPEIKCLQACLELAERLNMPLWLGETGENTNEWYAALYPLAVSLGIGYNLWPWKKMECTNSPCSIPAPRDYHLILDYIQGGKHPGFGKAREIFDEYLKNIRLENCELHPEVTQHVFRRVPFALMAADFDELPGAGISFRGSMAPAAGQDYAAAFESGGDGAAGRYGREADYRQGSGMKVVWTEEAREKRFAFDSRWDRCGLVLGEGEYADYTIAGCAGCATFELTLELAFEAEAEALLLVLADDCGEEVSVHVHAREVKVVLAAGDGVKTRVRIKGKEGSVCLKRLIFGPAE